MRNYLLKGLVLKCPKCGEEYEPKPGLYRCPKCGEPLLLKGGEEFVHPSLRRFSLGEGRTPIISRGKFFLKLEYLNPTGSFKDRGAAAAISYLLSSSERKVLIEDSSGNAGIAYSCYGNAAGFRVRVYVPSDIPAGKYAIMRACGSEVIRAGTRDEAHKAALSDVEGIYVGHTVNPYFIEGTKAIAKELLNDLGKAKLRESVIFAPVASGTLMLGLWKGFKELLSMGEIDELPKVVAVQACGYDYLSSIGALKVSKLSCRGEKTRFADALRLTKGERGRQTFEAVRELSGELVVVGDPAAMETYKELVRSGFLIEPTSSLAYAAAKYYMSEGLSNYAIVPLTGSGLKYIPAERRLWEILGV